MTIVMTCAGSLGDWVYPRNVDETEEPPEALIRVAGKPLIQWAVESVGSWPEPVEYVFIALGRHEDEYDLTGALRRFMRNRFRVLTIPKRRHGQLATAMVASATFSDGPPVLLASCNIFVVSDLREHVEQAGPGCRAVVVTRSADPAESFCAEWERDLFRDGYFTADAAPSAVPAGIYYFRDGRELADAGAAAVRAAAYASRSCPVKDVIAIYETRGWTVERRVARESWRIKDPFRARLFERRVGTALFHPHSQ